MGHKILVPLSFGYGRAIEGLGDLTSDIKDFSQNTEDYKLVLFTGGADVDPRLYGDISPDGLCCCNPTRDMLEVQIFSHARKFGIKMTGICRGSQLINVLSGGKMVHHVTGHAGGFHDVETSKGEVIETNSMHHQMIVPPDDGHVIGWARESQSNMYFGNKDEQMEWEKPETEIILVPRTMCCGVQWHPEMMGTRTPGYRYYYELMKKFLNMSIEDFTDEYAKHAKLGAV